jgi:hypothetical protein
MTHSSLHSVQLSRSGKESRQVRLSAFAESSLTGEKKDKHLANECNEVVLMNESPERGGRLLAHEHSLR